MLTDIARFWFEATGDICANHMRANPDPNVMVVERLEMMPVEIVVRDYLAGSTATSILPMYETGARKIYGVDFPDGLCANEKLPWTVITPTTKAGQGAHDAPLSSQDIIDRRPLDAAAMGRCRAKGLRTVLARPRDRGGARPDPRRYEI